MNPSERHPTTRYYFTLLAWILLPFCAVRGAENIEKFAVSWKGSTFDITRKLNVKPDSFVHVSTSLGDFTLELYPDSAPNTVKNFLNYVKSGSYQNALFHRSVPGFVIQTGGFSSTGVPIPTNPPVVNEYNQSNLRGTVAMAKVADDPNSATNQWFVNLNDNSANLDAQNGGFTVFARVLDPGMAVVDAIAALAPYNLGGAFESIPLRDIASGQDTITGANLVLVTSATASPYRAISSNPLAYVATVEGGTLRLIPGAEAERGATVTLIGKDSQGNPVEATFPVIREMREFAMMEISSPSIGSGTVEFELNLNAAPKTVANFRYLAESGFYDNTLFDRLFVNSRIEGGDPLTRPDVKDLVTGGSFTTAAGGPGYGIPDEFSLDANRAHVRGVISMSNSGARNSGGSRFLIMLGEDPNLDGKNASFGKLFADPGDLLTALSQIQNSQVPRRVKDSGGETLKEYPAPAEPITLRRVRIRREFSTPRTGKVIPATYAGKLGHPLRRAYADETPLEWPQFEPVSPANLGIQLPPPINFRALQIVAGNSSFAVSSVNGLLPGMTLVGTGLSEGTRIIRIDATSNLVFISQAAAGNHTNVDLQASTDTSYFTTPQRTPLSIARYSGNFTISTTRSGAISGRIRHYSLTYPFSGRALLQPDGTYLYEGKLGAEFGSPIYVKIRLLDGTPDSPGTVSIRLYSPANFEREIACGASEPYSPPRSRAELKPLLGIIENNEIATGDSYSFSGFGSFSLRPIHNNSALIGSGFLPDGRPFAFSAPISQAGCRSIVCPFQCELIPDMQVQRAGLRSLSPVNQWGISYLFGNQFIAAEMEIPVLTEPAKLKTYAWFQSIRKQIPGVSIPEYFGFANSYLQTWTPPLPRQPLAHFPQKSGIMRITFKYLDSDKNVKDITYDIPFQIGKDQRSAVFDNPQFKLQIDTRTGTFSGSAYRMPIRGILSFYGGRGQLLTPWGTTPIFLYAPSSQ